MKAKSRLMSLVLFALALAAAPVRAVDLPSDGSCPSLSRQQWQSYLEQTSRHYPNLSTSDYVDVLEVMRRCKSQFNLNGLNRCFYNLASFSGTMSRWRSPDYGMGFQVPNAKYLGRQPQEMMQLPEEFRDGLPKNWREIATKKGWPYLQYSSRTVPNPPYSAFTRLLFYIPGEKFDRWVQFTYPNDSPSRAQRLIDFITVQKFDGDTRLERPQIRYRQFWRDENGQQPLLRRNNRVENWHVMRDTGDSMATSDSCFSCHPNGMRQLSPAPESLQPIQRVTGDSISPDVADPDVPQARVDQFNQIMQSYGYPDVPDLNRESHGPNLGRALGCVKCHDGVQRGGIKVTTDFSMVVDHKLNGDHSMPPETRPAYKAAIDKANRQGVSSLTPDERRMYDEVAARQREYFELFKRGRAGEVRAWLTERPCVEQSSPAPQTDEDGADTPATPPPAATPPATEASTPPPPAALGGSTGVAN